MIKTVLEKCRQVPHRPGVYLMKDANGKTIYVGKAKDLKKRLSSYFVQKTQHDKKTSALLEMVKDFEIVITTSGHEAFILESNFIKEYRPKYNVLLKDGKNYPLLRVDMQETYPSIQRVRKIQNDKALYFGPYSSTHSMNKSLKQIQKIFKLRRCKNTQFKNRSRPCLNYQIKACLGLCCKDVDSDEYRKQVKNAILFLNGRSGQALKKLKNRMEDHARSQAFEKAALVRDTIVAIKNIMEKQVVVSPDLMDKDVVAVAAEKGRSVVTVMMIRSGYLIETAHYSFDMGFKKKDEVLSVFLAQYYDHLGVLPSIILLSQPIEDKSFLEEIFSRKIKKKVRIHTPMRGQKKRLVEMAAVNAGKELEKIIRREQEEQAAITLLRDILKMDRLPLRIECFDNSSLAGQDAVAAMVVFKDGRPFKKGYRRYIIRGIDVQDDYAYMYHVLERRFSKPFSERVFPDLLVVDGGKGQLGMAVAVLKDLKIENQFFTAGLAKKNVQKGETSDKIYVPGRSNPLNADQAKKALYLLQQIRDEAHRFAITFQRKRREHRAGMSELDSIKGIGPVKKQVLLAHFKGLTRMKTASIEEIASLPGMNPTLAGKVIQTLTGSDSPPDENN